MLWSQLRIPLQAAIASTTWTVQGLGNSQEWAVQHPGGGEVGGDAEDQEQPAAEEPAGLGQGGGQGQRARPHCGHRSHGWTEEDIGDQVQLVCDCCLPMRLNMKTAAVGREKEGPACPDSMTA